MESRGIQAFAALITFLLLAIPAIGMMFLAFAFYVPNIGLAWAFAVLSVTTFLLAVLVSVEHFR